ncbi:MAG: branched-chain amino acid transport [Deltaproteobacteria bacterium CG11_big_fil_rev_8_21_14_0_20_47_16]|nr:MAG: branched-chain amino acid transport [Deltaproteobacteria bacterium CG11_big_fil_rev_8_21_14_0_20_47_16]
MDANSQAYLTILGMAVITYLTRVTGLFLTNRIRMTPRTEIILKSLPGTIVVSIVAPALLTAGLAEIIAGTFTGLVAWKTRNLLFALLVGVLSVWALRQLIA